MAFPITLPAHPDAAYIGLSAPAVRKRAQRELRQEEVFRRRTFDLYFSKNNIQAFTWLVRDTIVAFVDPNLNLGMWRLWNDTLRIHTYSVMSDQEGGQRWFRRDAGRQSRDVVCNTDYSLRHNMMSGINTNAQIAEMVIQKAAYIREMNTNHLHALTYLESDDLGNKIGAYLRWSANQFAPPLVRIIEEFEDLSKLEAGQSILSQPLTLDWVLRKITHPLSDPGPLTHIECQYWIDIGPCVIPAPTALLIGLLADNLQTLKLQVGAMEHVSGVLKGHHGREAMGERYYVVDRDTLLGCLTAPNPTPQMLFLPEFFSELFSRAPGVQTLQHFELVANNSMPYWEAFWRPPGFVMAMPSIRHIITNLKISSFTFQNLQLLHDFLQGMSRTLEVCHLQNLRGSFHGDMTLAGISPWAALLEMFDQSLFPPGALMPFPNLEELHIENIQEERYYNGPGPLIAGIPPQIGYWAKWDATAIQENPFTGVGTAMFPFPITCEPVHGLLRTGVRPLTSTGGVIPAVPAIDYVAQDPFYTGGNAPIITTMPVQGVPAEPARPRYWFH